MPATIITKTCAKCKIPQNAKEFNKNSYIRSTLSSYCRKCRQQLRKDYKLDLATLVSIVPDTLRVRCRYSSDRVKGTLLARLTKRPFFVFEFLLELYYYGNVITLFSSLMETKTARLMLQTSVSFLFFSCNIIFLFYYVATRSVGVKPPLYAVFGSRP